MAVVRGMAPTRVSEVDAARRLSSLTSTHDPASPVRLGAHQDLSIGAYHCERVWGAGWWRPAGRGKG